MAAMFTTLDVDALVANFSPDSIFNDCPAVVKSNSGLSLVTFNHTLAQFKKTLQQSENRIDKSSLASLLEIDDGVEGWLYREANVSLKESRDGRQLLPTPVTDAIIERLNYQARESVVELDVFAKEADIRGEDLQQLIDATAKVGLKRVDADGSVFVYSDLVAGKISDLFRQGIAASAPETCDLTMLSDRVPHAIRPRLAETVAMQLGGIIRVEHKRIIYVPADYSTALGQKREQIRDRQVRELLRQLNDDGYCTINTTKCVSEYEEGKEDEYLPDLILKQWRFHHSDDAEPCRLSSSSDESDSGVIGFVMPESLRQGLERIKTSVINHAESLFKGAERSTKLKAYTQGLQQQKVSMLGLNELETLICCSEYVDDIVSGLSKHIDQLEHEEQALYSEFVKVRLSVPLQLYAIGIDAIKDSTLRNHLEEFTISRFRLEVVPHMVTAATEQSLLYDKERARQTDKLRQAVVEAKNIESLQSAVAKYMKRVKIDTSTQEQVDRVKYKTLEAAAKSIRQMSRGSDILQNLIWIFLAQKSVGLFMSAGRDTSRMIKQYEAVGDPERTRLLVHWKDSLKAGQESKEDLQSMKDAAKTALEELSTERTNSLATQPEES